MIANQSCSPRVKQAQRRLSRRSLRHHLLLTLGVGTGLAAGTLLLTPASLAVRLTTSSAYLALALLAATLLVSPLALLRGRRTVPSSRLRRNLGIWAGALSLAHVGLGLWARFGQEAYQVSASPAAPLLVATFAGVAASQLIVLLLALSNDAAIRKLGLPLWKRLQGLAIWLPPVTMVHGLLWLLLTNRGLPATVVLVFLACGPAVLRVATSALLVWRSRKR